MSEDVVYMLPNAPTPCQILIDPEICTGCNRCADNCRTQALMPNPDKGKPPVVLYPDECWFCGSCVDACSRPGAITMNHPPYNRVGWKRKDSGELFRIGMKNPPPPYKRPAVGK